MEWSGYFVFMLLAVAVCWPFEKTFPRLAIRNLSWQRIWVIFAIAILGLIVGEAFAWWLQPFFIDLMLKAKFFNLARLPIPDWLLILASLLLLDFIYYLAHVISHHVPFLWRLHKIHHADEHVTAFSGFLHHPLESIYAAMFMTGLAVVLGIPVLMLIIYGLVLAIHSMITHADTGLPRKLDRLFRWLIITPDFHRTHHSQDLIEGNSNFGGVLSVWDKLLGTYVAAPKQQLEQLSTGLSENSRLRNFTLKELLLAPFR